MPGTAQQQTDRERRFHALYTAHYPAMLAVNAASKLIPTGTTNPSPLAPGIIAFLCPPLRPDKIQACRPDDLNQFGADWYALMPNGQKPPES